MSIEDFFSSLSSEYCAPIAILGGLNVTARKEDESNSSNSSSSSDSKSSMETSNNPGSEQLSEVPNVITNPEALTAQTSSITGKRGTENLGIALFNEDVLLAELSAIESICHLLISNELDSCIISIDNPISSGNSEKMEIHLFPFKNSKVKVDIKNDKPYIYIKLFLEANVLNIDKEIDYKNEETILKISNETKKVLTEYMVNYLNKVSRKYNTDIDHFCAKAPIHFATLDEWKKFNWNEKFKSAEFDIDIELHN